MNPDRLHGEGEPPSLPATCGVAFKEWAGVCRALADGRQTLIVRKGGIAEDAGVFVPEHRVFWLYPTHVHEAEQGLRLAPAGTDSPAPGRPGIVPLDTLAVVASITLVDREEGLAPLAALHVWTEETIARRFHDRTPGLWVLGVRVYRRGAPHDLAVAPEHAGCKTWVPLDPPLPTDGCEAVLDDAELGRGRDRLRAALG
jgi:hypothetical protein